MLTAEWCKIDFKLHVSKLASWALSTFFETCVHSGDLILFDFGMDEVSLWSLEYFYHVCITLCRMLRHECHVLLQHGCKNPWCIQWGYMCPFYSELLFCGLGGATMASSRDGQGKRLWAGKCQASHVQIWPRSFHCNAVTGAINIGRWSTYIVNVIAYTRTGLVGNAVCGSGTPEVQPEVWCPEAT